MFWCVIIFFFKQKTAYEMRISDWSSDVCSSDLTLVSRDDISEQLSRIAVPALVVHGDSDAAISLDRARDMATRLPRAEWVVVPGAGHAANLTHPQPVNAAIEAFLAGL